MTLPPALLAKIDEAISHYPVSKRSASLPLLHLWQEHFGFISDEAITWIAEKLELQPINILELVTFYPMFRREPAAGDTSASAARFRARWREVTSCSRRLAEAAGIDLARRREHHHGDAEHRTSEHSSAQRRARQSHRGESRTASTRSSSWNASRAAAPRRWRWWMIYFKENIKLGGCSEAAGAAAERCDAAESVRRRIRGKSGSSLRISIAKAGRNDIDCYLRDGGYAELEEGAQMKPEEIVNEVKKVGLARSRRRGFSVRREVGLHQAGRDQADLSDLQRRRVGAGHVQGSLHHSSGSASAASKG